MTKFLSFALAVLASSTSIRGEETCAACVQFAVGMEDYFASNESLSYQVDIITGHMCALSSKPDICRTKTAETWPDQARRLLKFENATSLCGHIENCDMGDMMDNMDNNSMEEYNNNNMDNNSTEEYNNKTMDNSMEEYNYNNTDNSDCGDCHYRVFNIATFMKDESTKDVGIELVQENCVAHEGDDAKVAGCKQTIAETMPRVMDDFARGIVEITNDLCCNFSAVCC